MCVMSESIAKLTVALIDFHSKCPKIPKSSKNPFLNSRYADLATILEIVQPILNDCKLTVLQMPDGQFGLTTIISHESGEWIKSNYEMQPLESVIDKTTKEKAVTPQSLGSVITYQRRYALGALLCLNIDDDEDGNPPSPGELADKPAPRKSAAEILAEKKAAASSPTVAQYTSTTEAIAPTPAAATPATGGASLVGVASASVNGPCTVEQVTRVKSLLKDIEVATPGSIAKFKERLLSSGRSKVEQFTSPECDLMIAAIEVKNVEAFFQQSLTKAAA